MADGLSKLEIFNHLIFDVFLPLGLPQSELDPELRQQVDLLTTQTIFRSIHKFKAKDAQNESKWDSMANMVKRLEAYIQVPFDWANVTDDMYSMEVNDVMALYIRAQNACVVVRKGSTSTIFEIFEVQVPAEDVMSNSGKLLLRYPGPAVEIPNTIANDIAFLEEITGFLEHSDAKGFEEAVPTTRKAGSTVRETRNTADPNYFTQLFLGILGGMGTVFCPPRIVKRIADEVLWKDARNPWRRSPIWLIIRVVLQTSLGSTLLYKHFMAFHHAALISRCIKKFKQGFSSEVLFMMRAKMARRLLKIQDSAPSFVVEATRVAANDSQDILQRRWKAVQKDQARPPPWDPSTFDLDSATDITLPSSREYLEQIFRGRDSEVRRPPFVPNDALRLDNVRDLSDYADGALDRSFSGHKHVALFDFEFYVHNDLWRWVDSRLSEPERACQTAYSCLQQYLSAARIHYTADIADQSIMILTVMALWVAIDKFATSACSLLVQFSPEIPSSILNPLLLRSSQHLEQARLVQLHILRREQGALSSNHSIFDERIDSKCFGVQYFRQSSALQSLKSKIEAAAQKDRNEKIKELEDKNREYARLCERAEGMAHDYAPDEGNLIHPETGYMWDVKEVTSWDPEEPSRPMVHVSSCQRCDAEQRSRSMDISPHEWPLPTIHEEAEVVVFELHCPDFIAVWRDATYEVLWDLATESKNRDTFPISRTLQEYDGLQDFQKITTLSPRVTLASSTKSFNRSHYSKVTIPAPESSVCVNNGLSFQLYDKTDHVMATHPFVELSLARFGTLSVPKSSPYQHLNYTVEGTTHTSNQVLADQHECPKTLSLHEHISFGTLRSGPRLQWLNIARGLEERILSFNRMEVGLLHTQAAWQIGPLSEDLSLREWHLDLEEPNFRVLLIAQCFRLLERIRGNWLEAGSLSLIVLLVTRLLAASSNSETESAYKLLCEARQVASNWLVELESKVQAAGTGSNTADYQYLICDIAVTCRSTFDAGLIHLPNLLRTRDDFIALLNSAVLLYNNQPSAIPAAQSNLSVRLARERRFAHQIAPYILHLLNEDRGLFSSLLSNIWPDYRCSPEGVRFLAGRNKNWVFAASVTDDGSSSPVTHLNLMNGRLLIDGIPLGRLPRKYQEDPVYVQLFGETILPAVPINTNGMEFASRNRIHGYQVLFSLDKLKQQLIVQARKDGETFQLVPQSTFLADLPESFSTDYHHWVNLRTRAIEFRPLLFPWSHEYCQWQITFSHDGKAVMRNLETGSLLVGIHSSLFKSIATQLAPLESPRYLHVSQSTQSLIQVVLPRMKLQFFINEDMQLESRNFREQVVDANQSTGAFFGLQNQLVLCEKLMTALSPPRPRSVLVPHGDISISCYRHHVLVVIQPESGKAVRFHQYHVNTDLGYLACNTGLTSRLFKIYLHALTSHCLPDVLTGRTGTEEALYELTEPTTSSFEQIDEEQAKLLGLIGSLTPKRVYYPPHLTCMQTTFWGGIPTLSQHYGFGLASAALLHRSDTLQLFFPLGFKPSAYITSTKKVLLKRVVQRTALFYPSEMEAYRHLAKNSSLHDSGQSTTVKERLLLSWGVESQSAAWSFRLLSRGQSELVSAPVNLVNQAESWGLLSGARDDLDLKYSPHWLHLSLAELWMTMYDLIRKSSVTADLYGLSFCLAAVVFSQKLPLRDLPMLVAFAANPKFFQLDPPEHSLYQLEKDGYSPLRSRIQDIVSSKRRSIEVTPVAKAIKLAGKAKGQSKLRRQQEYEERISEYLPTLVDHYWTQLPSNHLTSPPKSEPCTVWFDIESCTNEVQSYFTSCTKNAELRTHLRKIERALASNPTSQEPRVAGDLILHQVDRHEMGCHQPGTFHAISLTRLMSSRPGPERETVAKSFGVGPIGSAGTPIETSRLSGLFDEFQKSESPLNRRYGHELDTSRKELCSKHMSTIPGQLPPRELFVENDQLRKSHCNMALHKLEHALGPETPIEQVVFISGLWPRLTPRTLLGCLSLRARNEYSVGPRWHNALIEYAAAFLEYQHSRRLVGLLDSGSPEELMKELDVDDNGVSDANKSDPDWLLVQIDGNFRARAVQRRVAQEMITPSSCRNTALQLNMGEGKSSVIVPIIAAVLADTKKLVRVVVLKPLWRQMFHLLVNRLSGLVHRRIYYLPFARNVQLDTSQVRQLQELYAECMREGGILLAQPEHILSFKLMGIDHLVSNSHAKRAASMQLRDMQKWLTMNTRDVLDESDEILHVRYQLVYTVGTQRPVENHPERWTITQQLLQITKNHILRLGNSNPNTLYCEAICGGRYPIIQIMHDCGHQFERQLTVVIAKDVLEGHVLGLNFSRLSRQAWRLALDFLTNKDMSYEDSYMLLGECDEVMQKGLFLLRGLLALGVLMFVLKNKRYRVDYGLDPSRSVLAVPYRAKDVPSLRAEFGHPDVAILLTCLSYYYKGLTYDQLTLCFELLYKLDNPSFEYEQWVRRGGAVPNNLLRLEGINMKDQEQFKEIVLPLFSQNSATIDFFLSSMVFPKAAKEFSHKLATSGWDLVESKTHPTTGFSGTNDNQYLLPTSITQSDPVQQLSTNALVLTYLLQPENNHYMCMRDKSGGPFTTKGFLKQLVGQQPEVRVLLDVGAQMLELQNEELVRWWLSLRPDIEAAVCFNDKDELIVVSQNGTVSAFYSSPYSRQLDRCIVYLDDAHTRGTDLNLPRHSHALVTLGPRVTKDRLLQGCMRMRKLGHGQSVVFAAPPEIDRQIRSSASQPLASGAKVDALDILRWAMLETCQDLRRHVSDWAHQGLEHNRRAEAENHYASTGDIGALKSGWMTSESRSLEEMYGIQKTPGRSSSNILTSHAHSIAGFRERLNLFGDIVLDGSRVDEEQEREVSHEIERQRQVEYPSKEQAANHQLHHDILHFVRTGSLPTDSYGVLYLHRPLSPSKSPNYPWSKDLGGSVDFFRTVINISPISLSDYMRPVNWVLRGSSGVHLILSPFEVNELLPLIRQSEFVQLHVYAPRTIYSMRSFSDLQFYSIPHTQPSIHQASAISRNQLQLDLFAGQLYLPSYEGYLLLSAILGVYNMPYERSNLPDVQTQSDGFVVPEHRQNLAERMSEYSECRLANSPIPILRELIGRRRKGMEYMRTHIGLLLYSQSTKFDDFVEGCGISEVQ